ncbi:putative zinc ribbon protein [Pectobacterium polaris]|uniref:putative zinc ribbon protein n=1 Tax=Pectobacterium polaris TaxID=2042057 RepID=UPI0032E4BB35
MFAKSFLALDGNGHLTGARTAQTPPYDRYTCHLCKSKLQYHPEYITERPWFEHIETGSTDNSQHNCPYVKPDTGEMQLARRLDDYSVSSPNSTPKVSKADWQCTQCKTNYYGERYCLTCRTVDFSQPPEIAS